MRDLVVAEGLGFSIRGNRIPILADVSLSLGGGERVICTGPSGSGKTTLGIHLAGFHDVALEGTTTGRLLLGGQDAKRSKRRGFAGLVLQNPSTQLFYPTVNDEVEAVRSQLPTGRSRIGHWVERLELGPLLGCRVEELSLGQKQLLSVGLMLMAERRLLVLDEPTSYLDERHARVLLAALTSATKEGLTVVVIDPSLPVSGCSPGAPDAGPLLGWASRAIRVEHGHVTYDGPAHALPTEGAIERPRLSRGQETREAQLVVEQVSFGYGKGPDVLSGVSLTVSTGEVVILRGANASGKTTLLELIQGLREPRQGQVHYRGASSSKWLRPRSTRLPAALVLQSPDEQLFGATVSDECGVGLGWTGIPRGQRLGRVARALQAFGLDALDARVPFTLSFGEKRRLTVASALVLDPDLLLLDEPSVGLDPMSAQLLVGAIAGRAAAGGATLIATHDRELERAIATRVVTLANRTITSDEPYPLPGEAA